MTVKLALGVVVSIALVGCGGAREASPEAACSAQDGSLAADATFDSREGAYRLTLVATSGDSVGRDVTGSLSLAPNDSVARQFMRPGDGVDPSVLVPLYGWTDVSVTGVGARRLGDLASRDPARPGVLVLEQRVTAGAPPSITVRMGSQSNRRDEVLFDGGYTALRVGWIDEDGAFGGSWASGVRTVEAEGHFCAFELRATSRELRDTR